MFDGRGSDPDGRTTVAPLASDAVAPLGGIAVLSASESLAGSSRPLDPMDAMVSLFPHHRVSGLKDARSLADHTEAVGRLAREVPVFNLTRGRTLESTADELLDWFSVARQSHR